VRRENLHGHTGSSGIKVDAHTKAEISGARVEFESHLGKCALAGRRAMDAEIEQTVEMPFAFLGQHQID
jgi:hypothetical protein